ncbi:MAG: glycosyltransferase family 39 protein [Gaiellales bacterium]
MPARLAARWLRFEAWVGSRSSAAALFLLGLAVFGLQSIAIPVAPGRDMVRYVQLYLQLGNDHPFLPNQLADRGPLAGLAVGLPLQLGGVAAEVWLALLFAASVVTWGAIARTFGARPAIATSALLLAYPGYGILFHGLSSDAPFAAGFAGWAFLLTKAVRRPSATAFLLTGLGMGLLVLVRPANQVLVVMALVPLVLRVPWSRRLAMVASYFIGSVAVTQGWKELVALRYDDTVGVRPSLAAVGVALLLGVLLLPARWRRRAAVLVLPGAVVLVGALAVAGSGMPSPTHYARSVIQSPDPTILLYRAFVMDRIVAPDNGHASRELGRVVRRELLTQEPYRSYHIDLETFFSSGSTRMFFDVGNLGGVDMSAVTGEAIRKHPWTFGAGVVRTAWEILAVRRVYYVPVAEAPAPGGNQEQDYVVIGGRKLPRPTDGEPIPASHFLQRAIVVDRRSAASQVWRSPTDPELVFLDARAEQRWKTFQERTARLFDRIPTRSGDASLAHRLNQASHRFPSPAFWLVVGLVALAVRRPRFALAALVPSVAGLAVVLGTALVTESVAHYAAPVSPAFMMLAAVGALGEGARRGSA